MHLLSDPDSMLPLTAAECEQEIRELKELQKHPLVVRMFSRLALDARAIDAEINSPPVDVASIFLRERLFGQRKTLGAAVALLQDEIDILLAHKLSVEEIQQD